MNMARIVRVMVAGCTAVVLTVALDAGAQTPAAHQHPAADAAKPASGMAAKDHAMMAEREKMMAEMKTADQRLDTLVVAMNTASAKTQAAATAVVVTEIVAQRRAMQAGMMKMQDGMMAHMMAHMQDGKDSMAACPMMKPMGGSQP